jgi:hypothetical protein
MNQPCYKQNSATALVKADYPQTAGIPPNRGTITSAVKGQLWSSAMQYHMGNENIPPAGPQSNNQCDSQHFLQNAYLFPDDHLLHVQHNYKTPTV